MLAKWYLWRICWEAEISQYIPFPVVVLICLLDNSTNNDLAANRFWVHQSETKTGQCEEVYVCLYVTIMCVYV